MHNEKSEAVLRKKSPRGSFQSRSGFKAEHLSLDKSTSDEAGRTSEQNRIGPRHLHSNGQFLEPPPNKWLESWDSRLVAGIQGLNSRVGFSSD